METLNNQGDGKDIVLKKEERKMFYCKSCLAPSARPRIVFNSEGVCNACLHAEYKRKNTDWKKRWNEVEKLCDKYRRKDGSFDVIVPGSGGKDSSYVAWKMKHELGMHPLCITVASQMPTEIGKRNLENFIKAGFDHIMVSPDPESYRKLAKVGLIEEGQPKEPFISGITTIVVEFSIKLNIPFLMYGEQGEAEYGGSGNFDKKYFMDRAETVTYYFSGCESDRAVGKMGISDHDVKWWRFPSQEVLDKSGVLMAYWSYFEDWNPYEHYLFAKKHCGFQTLPTRSIGTYTNFAQLDDDLQDLHVYLMFLKFGFGRATSDACIDVRRGALDRKQALALVRRYDGEYPEQLIGKFVEYFRITRKEFDDVLDKFANKDVLEKVNGIWKLKFEPY
ncbi:MAG: N-acetyl sugar amidotransferase [Candidatus Omnitrophica bacterium]|nr:N-acetyl sugar amidotransferase [Candidatus Omnitrophota bacterium]MDD5352413.1 N-acetyl sugar amidotransferase [Candidatus Omnitrophota bacterium]MDD5550011.1 N-acetyl sugar amidotransferase [Candidatus Omnitrophota bacterium]